MTVKNYRELIVWQRAMEVVEMVYTLTKGFPNDERFGLTSQVRRAAVSIPSNIAEGQARDSTAEFLRFLSIAQGSRAEVETRLLIASQLGYATRESIDPILDKLEEVKRMTYSLKKKLSPSHSPLPTSH
jgi:four helix bundle protein